eukprot:176362-Rhodomonas_salina.2
MGRQTAVGLPSSLPCSRGACCRQYPPKCRVFIGNLATEKTNVDEIAGIFAKYGRLAEKPVLLRSFGFVQYDDPRAAQRAIDAENGMMLGGLKTELSLADNRPIRPRSESDEKEARRG